MHRFVPLIIIFTCFFGKINAQKKQSSSSSIHIDTAGTLRGEQVGETYTQYLSGDVVLSHKGSQMYCDSCVLNESNKTFKAYGKVTVIQSDGTILNSNYLYYNGNTSQCNARGDVSLIDGQNNLWADAMSYNLKSKVATYTGDGVLQNEETTLWSEKGIYNGKTHMSHFTKNVRIQGVDYDIVSDELKYNTETKEVFFIRKSDVYKDGSLMRTSGNGYYDSRGEIAEFNRPTEVYNQNQYIKANKLRYDKAAGYAYAKGKVFVKDTAQKVMLFAGEGYFLDKEKESIIYDNPLLVRYDTSETDSLFLSSDTLRSFDVVYEVNHFLEVDSEGIEQMQSDTIYRKNFIAWNNVTILSDSVQAVADSMFYSQLDSNILLYKDPVLWSDQRQMKGDTIYIYMAGDNNLDSVKLLTASSILAIPKKIPDGLDQILGNNINIFFEEEDIDSLEVIKNAQCILYIEDENEKYIGIHRSESNELYAGFNQGEIDIIKLNSNITGKMIPVKDADYKSLRFDQSIWLEERRPVDKNEFYLRMKFLPIPKKKAPTESEKEEEKSKTQEDIEQPEKDKTKPIRVQHS